MRRVCRLELKKSAIYLAFLLLLLDLFTFPNSDYHFFKENNQKKVKSRLL